MFSCKMAIKFVLDSMNVCNCALLCVYLQDGMGELVNDDNNNCLPDTDQLLSVDVVTQSSAVSVEEVGRSIPVISRRVSSPPADFYAGFSSDECSDFHSDVECWTPDAVSMSNPVSVCHGMSTLEHSNIVSATERLWPSVDDFSQPIPAIISQLRNQAITEDADEHLLQPHLVEPAHGLDQASASLVRYAHSDTVGDSSSAISDMLSQNSSILTSLPLAVPEPLCLLPSYVPVGYFSTQLTGVPMYLSNEMLYEPSVSMLRSLAPVIGEFSSSFCAGSAAATVHEILSAVTTVPLTSLQLSVSSPCEVTLPVQSSLSPLNSREKPTAASVISPVTLQLSPVCTSGMSNSAHRTSLSFSGNTEMNMHDVVSVPTPVSLISLGQPRMSVLHCAGGVKTSMQLPVSLEPVAGTSSRGVISTLNTPTVHCFCRSHASVSGTMTSVLSGRDSIDRTLTLSDDGNMGHVSSCYPAVWSSTTAECVTLSAVSEVAVSLVSQTTHTFVCVPSNIVLKTVTVNLPVLFGTSDTDVSQSHLSPVPSEKNHPSMYPVSDNLKSVRKSSYSSIIEVPAAFRFPTSVSSERLYSNMSVFTSSASFSHSPQTSVSAKDQVTESGIIAVKSTVSSTTAPVVLSTAVAKLSSPCTSLVLTSVTAASRVTESGVIPVKSTVTSSSCPSVLSMAVAGPVTTCTSSLLASVTVDGRVTECGVRAESSVSVVCSPAVFSMDVAKSSSPSPSSVLTSLSAVSSVAESVVDASKSPVSSTSAPVVFDATGDESSAACNSSTVTSVTVAGRANECSIPAVTLPVSSTSAVCSQAVPNPSVAKSSTPCRTALQTAVNLPTVVATENAVFVSDSDIIGVNTAAVISAASSLVVPSTAVRQLPASCSWSLMTAVSSAAGTSRMNDSFVSDLNTTGGMTEVSATAAAYSQPFIRAALRKTSEPPRKLVQTSTTCSPGSLSLPEPGIPVCFARSSVSSCSPITACTHLSANTPSSVMATVQPSASLSMIPVRVVSKLSTALSHSVALVPSVHHGKSPSFPVICHSSLSLPAPRTFVSLDLVKSSHCTQNTTCSPLLANTLSTALATTQPLVSLSLRPVAAVTKPYTAVNHSTVFVRRIHRWKPPSFPVMCRGSLLSRPSASSLQGNPCRVDARCIRPMSGSSAASSARMMSSFQYPRAIRHASYVSHIE